MKYRSILELSLNNWYNWFVETKNNESYLVVLLEMLKNNKKIK